MNLNVQNSGDLNLNSSPFAKQANDSNAFNSMNAMLGNIHAMNAMNASFQNMNMNPINDVMNGINAANGINNKSRCNVTSPSFNGTPSQSGITTLSSVASQVQNEIQFQRLFQAQQLQRMKQIQKLQQQQINEIQRMQRMQRMQQKETVNKVNETKEKKRKEDDDTKYPVSLDDNMKQKTESNHIVSIIGGKVSLIAPVTALYPSVSCGFSSRRHRQLQNPGLKRSCTTFEPRKDRSLRRPQRQRMVFSRMSLAKRRSASCGVLTAVKE